MADLRWAIGRYNEPGYDEWYIYDVETDMTICDSPVRKTLEIILELLAACEELTKELGIWVAGGDMIHERAVVARDMGYAALTKANEGRE